MLDFPSKTISPKAVFLRKIKYIKNILKKEQKIVEKNLQEVKKDDPAMNQGLAETHEPGIDSYIADIHTKDVVIEEQLKKANTSIKAALLKIRKGSYGKCEKCGKQIEIGRLLAMPTAQYCLTCSKKSQK